MGRKLKNLNREITFKQKIPKDIRNLVTHNQIKIDDNLLKSRKLSDEESTKEDPIVKELCDNIKKYFHNSEKYITITRFKRLFGAKKLYNVSCDLQDKNADGSLYITRLQIYKHCRDKLFNSFNHMQKVDDSKFTAFGRLFLHPSIECYLFSLIHPDTLNFDASGNFVCDQIAQNFDAISQLEYELSRSILLDGFLLAFDEIIIRDNTNYDIAGIQTETSSETEAKNKTESNNNSSKTLYSKISIEHPESHDIEKKEKDYSYLLLELLSPAMLYMCNLYDNIHSGETFYVHATDLLTQKLFVCKKYSKDRIALLFNVYNSIAKDMSNVLCTDSGSYLYDLLNLYHINRYTHIFDMHMMQNFDNATPHFHKFNGLLTSITINKIFNKNDSNRIDALKYDMRFKNSILYTSILEERDYVFIQNLIHAIAGIFKDMFLATYDNRLVDQKKAYNMFISFSEDESIQQCLRDIDVSEYLIPREKKNTSDPDKNTYAEITETSSKKKLYDQFSTCFNLIYDDLYAACICRRDCHSCTDILPSYCPQTFPGKVRSKEEPIS